MLELGVALVLLFVMLLFAVDSAIGGLIGAGVARLTAQLVDAARQGAGQWVTP